jgi:hypothetical protein
LLSAVPLLDAGVTIYRQYFDAIQAFGGASRRYGNASLPAAFVRFGLPDLSAFIMVAGTLALGVYVKRLRPDTKALNDLGITSAILFAPLAWSCYVIYLLPVLFSRPWRWPERLSLALFSLPLWLVGVPEHVRTFGLAYCVALVVLFAAIMLATSPIARSWRLETSEAEPVAVGLAA